MNQQTQGSLPRAIDSASKGIVCSGVTLSCWNRHRRITEKTALKISAEEQSKSFWSEDGFVQAVLTTVCGLCWQNSCSRKFQESLQKSRNQCSGQCSGAQTLKFIVIFEQYSQQQKCISVHKCNKGNAQFNTMGRVECEETCITHTHQCTLAS